MCMHIGKHARWMYVYMYVLTSIFMQAEMHGYVGMYICMYVVTYVDMHKSTDVSLCACIIRIYACAYLLR